MLGTIIIGGCSNAGPATTKTSSIPITQPSDHFQRVAYDKQHSVSQFRHDQQQPSTNEHLPIRRIRAVINPLPQLPLLQPPDCRKGIFFCSTKHYGASGTTITVNKQWLWRSYRVEWYRCIFRLREPWENLSFTFTTSEFLTIIVVFTQKWSAQWPLRRNRLTMTLGNRIWTTYFLMIWVKEGSRKPKCGIHLLDNRSGFINNPAVLYGIRQLFTTTKVCCSYYREALKLNPNVKSDSNIDNASDTASLFYDFSDTKQGDYGFTGVLHYHPSGWLIVCGVFGFFLTGLGFITWDERRSLF